jgi:hypothetical protein
VTVEGNGEFIPVRKAHRFDEGCLGKWMAANIDGFGGPLTIAQFGGGQSNLRTRSPLRPEITCSGGSPLVPC